MIYFFIPLWNIIKVHGAGYSFSISIARIQKTNKCWITILLQSSSKTKINYHQCLSLKWIWIKKCTAFYNVLVTTHIPCNSAFCFIKKILYVLTEPEVNTTVGWSSGLPRGKYEARNMKVEIQDTPFTVEV